MATETQRFGGSKEVESGLLGKRYAASVTSVDYELRAHVVTIYLEAIQQTKARKKEDFVIAFAPVSSFDTPRISLCLPICSFLQYSYG